MTLVFQREKAGDPRVPPGPRTHAFILGCGRFPALGNGAAREATVAGAREVVSHLLQHQDNLVAPLGTIECLLSDPAVAPGADTLGLPPFKGDPRKAGDDRVDNVITRAVQDAGAAWLERCEPGDQLFFYMATHGVADHNITASGLFEDVLSNRYKKWSASLNVNSLCLTLPVTKASACWVFFDACQELIPDLLGTNDGLAGVTLVDATPKDIANVKVRAVGIAGSLFGQNAWAPNGPQPPYFTQALLEAFNACVDRRDDGAWVVTAQRLLFSIPDVAAASFGYEALPVQSLSAFASSPELMTVAAPKVPVVVRTKDIADMAYLQHVTMTDGKNPPLVVPRTLTNCFARLPPDGLCYEATGVFDPPMAYQTAKFVAAPCARIVVLMP
jgi:hypothetical protein